jgi:hypothetical protein
VNSYLYLPSSYIFKQFRRIKVPTPANEFYYLDTKFYKPQVYLQFFAVSKSISDWNPLCQDDISQMCVRGQSPVIKAFWLLRHKLITYTYSLLYSMEQSPSREANGLSASQEIPHILYNPKVYYRIHK